MFLAAVGIAAHSAGAAAPSPTLTTKVVENEVDTNFDLRCTLSAATPKSPPASLLLGYRNNHARLALVLGAGNLTLVRPGNGAKSTLAEVKTETLPDKRAVPVVVQWRDGALRVIYNNHVVMRRENLGSLEGTDLAIMAGAAGGASVEDALYQPVEPVHFADDFMRSGSGAGMDLWQASSGTWRLNTAGDVNLGANPFAYIAQGKGAASVAGRWFWSDYSAAVSVHPAAKSGIGIIADWQDDKNYIVSKWYASDSGVPEGQKKQLWRVSGGQPMLMASAPGGFRSGQWYRLGMTAANGIVSTQIDGQTVFEKPTDLFGQGKAGLFYDGDKPTMFDDVTVVPAGEAQPLPVDQVAAGPARFAKDASMEDWSSPKNLWLPSPTAPGVLWNRGTFFGNYGVDVTASGITGGGAQVTTLLGGDGISANSAYALQVKPAADTKFVACTLLRAGIVVDGPNRKLLEAGTTHTFKVQRQGSRVRALVDQVEVAHFMDAHPLQGRRAGYAAQVARVAPADAHVSGGNMIDYTFYNAPTDWWVGSGTWDVASRWICTPTWTWFAGWSDRVAAIWNKRTFDGDFAVEVFAASKMDLAQAPYYAHPRDLNITIAGDGQDLSSGYSCIFGGWNDTSTRILRGTQTVAQTEKILLPVSALYHKQAHHKWFCLRVEKTGDTISYYVDRQLALTYKDPHPLEGKRIALWTAGNGIMVARATIYYENQTLGEPLPVTAAPVPAENEAPAAQVQKLNWQLRGTDPGLALTATLPQAAGERPAVRVVNISGGGNFAVRPQVDPFDLAKNPRLTFQCRINPGTEVNLYLTVKGALHAVRLTGPAAAQDAPGVKGLSGPNAEVGAAADGKWHDVDLDLAALLAPLYPGEGHLQVDEVFLGDLAQDSYEQAGFGVNQAGSSYLVRNFALRTEDSHLIKVVEPQLSATSAAGPAKVFSSSFKTAAKN